jgi:hypothetical protein
MCLELWRCKYILDSDTRLGVERSSPTLRLLISWEHAVLRILSEGSLVHKNCLNDAEKRNPLLVIEPGFSCRLGRGLVNNWVYLTEEPDFRGEKIVSNATCFVFMLFSCAGDRFVLSHLRLFWLWTHSHWAQHHALLTCRGSDWEDSHTVISQWLQGRVADPRHLQLWPHFVSIKLRRPC